MRTWTCNILGHSFVVTADNIGVAAHMVGCRLKELTGKPYTIYNQDLIPLPTHHRYIRLIERKTDATETRSEIKPCTPNNEE